MNASLKNQIIFGRERSVNKENNTKECFKFHQTKAMRKKQHLLNKKQEAKWSKVLAHSKKFMELWKKENKLRREKERLKQILKSMNTTDDTMLQNEQDFTRLQIEGMEQPKKGIEALEIERPREEKETSVTNTTNNICQPNRNCFVRDGTTHVTNAFFS